MLDANTQASPSSERQATLQRELRAAEEPVVGRLQCPICGQSQIRRDASAFCVSCGSPMQQPCPACGTSIPLCKGAAMRCPNCDVALRSCIDCHRLYQFNQLQCSNDYCPSYRVYWTVKAAGGEERWAMAGGDAGRAGHLTYEGLHQASQTWQAGPLAEEVYYGPVNGLGIVALVSKQGSIYTFAEAGAPAELNSTDDGGALPLRQGRVESPHAVTAPPVFWDGSLLLGLADGTLARVEIDGLKTDILGAVNGGAVEAVVATQTNFALVTADGTLSFIGREGSLLAEFKASSLITGDTPTEVRWAPPLVDGDRVLMVYNFEMAGGDVRSVLAAAEARGTTPLWKLAEEVPYALIMGGSLILIAEGHGYRVDQLNPFDASTAEKFPLPGALAFAPTVTQDGKLIGVGRRDGLLTAFLPRADARTSSHGSYGTNYIWSQPLASNYHFIFAGPEYVYLDRTAISTKLLGRAHRHMSYANGRVFVSTNKEGGLYAFALS